MGLGKTVQIAAFLMALFGKSGRRSVDVPMGRARSRQGYKVEEGSEDITTSTNSISSLCPPCLIIAPASLVANWHQELKRWGFFLVATLNDRSSSITAIDAANEGRIEILLGSYHKMEMYSDELAKVAWSVIVWDEGIKCEGAFI